jgi:hypothetical protein
VDGISTGGQKVGRYRWIGVCGCRTEHPAAGPVLAWLNKEKGSSIGRRLCGSNTSIVGDMSGGDRLVNHGSGELLVASILGCEAKVCQLLVVEYATVDIDNMRCVAALPQAKNH